MSVSGVCGVTGSGLVSTPPICSSMATSRPTRTHSKIVDILLPGTDRGPLSNVRLPTSPWINVPMLALHASILTLLLYVNMRKYNYRARIWISERAAQTRLFARAACMR